MDIVLRSYWQCGSTPRWRRFETLLKRSFQDLGHPVHDVPSEGLSPVERGDSLAIYPHCRKRDVPGGWLFYKEMYLRGLFTLDSQGWGADHSAMDCEPNLGEIDDERAASFVETIRDRYFSGGASKVPQPEPEPVDETLKPYWLVPLQLQKDQAIRFFSPISVVDFVELIAGWAHRRGRKVVFKLHPGHEEPAAAAAVAKWEAASPFIFCLDHNIHSLIESALGVAVITSGTGFEALIHGKPVAVMGDVDYSWVCCRMTRDNLDLVDRYFIDYSRAQTLRAYRFLEFYFTRHAFETHPSMEERTLARMKAFLAARLPQSAFPVGLQREIRI